MKSSMLLAKLKVASFGECNSCMATCEGSRSLSHLDVAGYILFAVKDASVLGKPLPAEQLIIVGGIDQGWLLQSFNFLSVCEAAMIHHYCFGLQASSRWNPLRAALIF